MTFSKMKYPKKYSNGQEPKTICKGDLVWWNEGVCVGFVEEVLESKEEYELWGLDEPSIAFTNLHPFEMNDVKHQQHIGFVTSGGTVVHPLDRQHLEDEGIGLLSDHELSEFNWATQEAKSRVDPEYRDFPCCVSAHKDMGRGEEDWYFCFVGRECEVLQTVIFPFRPNTRT